MLLHLSVSHSVHRGACVAGGGMRGRRDCMVGDMRGRGGMAGGCAWWGVCMAGGVHGEGHAWQGVQGRGRAWQIPRDTVNERAVADIKQGQYQT